MSDRETLEKSAPDLGVRGLSRQEGDILRDAIRGVLEENKRLRAKIDYTSTSRELAAEHALMKVKFDLRQCKEENVRLRRDLGIAHAAQSASAEGWHHETAKIEAALALHGDDGYGRCSHCNGEISTTCVILHPCPTVKALRGEK